LFRFESFTSAYTTPADRSVCIKTQKTQKYFRSFRPHLHFTFVRASEQLESGIRDADDHVTALSRIARAMRKRDAAVRRCLGNDLKELQIKLPFVALHLSRKAQITIGRYVTSAASL